MIAELVYVLDRWKIPPTVWLEQPDAIRRGIFKHVALESEALDAFREKPGGSADREPPESTLDNF